MTKRPPATANDFDTTPPPLKKLRRPALDHLFVLHEDKGLSVYQWTPGGTQRRTALDLWQAIDLAWGGHEKAAFVHWLAGETPVLAGYEGRLEHDPHVQEALKKILVRTDETVGEVDCLHRPDEASTLLDALPIGEIHVIEASTEA